MAAGTHENRPVALLGGGGHALVVADAGVRAGVDIAGFYDDSESAVLCTSARWLGTLQRGVGAAVAGSARPFLAVGAMKTRTALGIELGQSAGAAPAIVDPSAVVSASAVLGAGVFVGPCAAVNAGAVVGAHAIVNTAAVIEHECVVGAGAHVGPGAVLGGAARIGAWALVGLGSRVAPGIAVGDGAVVGAGAVAVRSVPAGQTVVGVPARRLK